MLVFEEGPAPVVLWPELRFQPVAQPERDSGLVVGQDSQLAGPRRQALCEVMV